MRPFAFVLSLGLLLPTAAHAASPTPLHSPWDASPIALTDAPYKCPPMTHAAPNITITGDAAIAAHRNHTAAYPEAVTALDAIVRQVIGATQAYQATGSRAAVNCAIGQFVTAAQDRAMTGRIVDTTVGKHEIEVLRALSIAYLILQPSGGISPDRQNASFGWMNTALHNFRAYYDHTRCGPNTCVSKSHTYLEIAVCAGALGIAEQDPNLYHWAIGQYHDGVKRIDKYGMLHYDTMHREYALKFNTDSAGALVQLAEFGESNGDDLYAYDKGRVHLLIIAVTRGLLDPTPFAQASGTSPQELNHPLQPEDIAWAVPYNVRFHDAVIAGELRDAGVLPADSWTDSPSDNAPADTN